MTLIRLARTYVTLALFALIACGEDPTPQREARIVAQVVPLQSVSLEGLLPDGVRQGIVRFEAQHFNIEVPLTTTTPLTVLAPIYIAEDGTFASGKVAVYFRPDTWATEDALAAPVSGTVESSSPAHEDSRERPGDIDLGLDLEIAPLPKFDYVMQPGVLVRSFLEGAREFQARAYDDLLASRLPKDMADAYRKQRDDGLSALALAIEMVDRVRRTGVAEPLGSMPVANTTLYPELSLASLQIVDQLVAGLVVAHRTGAWLPVRAQRQGLVSEALAVWDIESEVRDFFPRMFDEVASEALATASRLASGVSTLTKVASAVAAGAAIVGGSATVAAVGSVAAAAAVTGAVAFYTLTYAPAAIATVIKAGGNLIRGGGSLRGYASDTLRDGLEHVVTNNLGAALGALQEKLLEPLAKSRAGVLAAKLVEVVEPFKGMDSRLGSTIVDCALDLSGCVSAWKMRHDDDTPPEQVPNEQDPGEPQVGQCNQAQVSGADTPETRIFDVGSSCVDLTLTFDTYSQQDAITVEYEGREIASTGCVGADGALPISICGSSTEVVVKVEPNCAGGTGTAWDFTLECPAE